MVAIKLANKIN